FGLVKGLLLLFKGFSLFVGAATVLLLAGVFEALLLLLIGLILVKVCTLAGAMRCGAFPFAEFVVFAGAGFTLGLKRANCPLLNCWPGLFVFVMATGLNVFPVSLEISFGSGPAAYTLFLALLLTVVLLMWLLAMLLFITVVLLIMVTFFVSLT